MTVLASPCVTSSERNALVGMGDGLGLGDGEAAAVGVVCGLVLGDGGADG